MMMMMIDLSASESCTSEDEAERRHASQVTYDYVYPGTAELRKRVTLAGLFPLHKAENGCRDILEVKNYNGFQRSVTT